jgi:hypothetical protein
MSGTLGSFTTACSAGLERARAQVAALKTLKTATEGRALLEAHDEATRAKVKTLNAV